MGDHHFHPGIERPSQAQRVAESLRVAALDGFFLAAMDDQRRTCFGQHAVEGIALGAGRVHAHGGRQPFYGARAVGDGLFQVIGRRCTIRMQGGHPLEARRKIPRQLGRPGIRHVKGRMLGMGVALAVVKALESKEHDLEAFRHRVAQVEQARDISLIDLARRIVGAAGIHVEQALGVM